MPYVITTRREGRLPGREHDHRYSRRAVATLDEAQAIVAEQVRTSGLKENMWAATWRQISESGGTIGPLPDGTVIEVEHVRWEEIRAGIRGPWTSTLGDGGRATIDAYNAAQGVKA